jgi:hypothetical protein
MVRSRLVNRSSILIGCVAILVTITSCGNGGKGVDNGNAGGGGFKVTAVGGAGTAGDAAPGADVTTWPPSSDYTNVTDVTYGAYALGPDISSGRRMGVHQ